MSKITIDCDCGEYIKTKVDSDYDVLKLGEDGDSQKKIICPKCHTKYDVYLRVNIN